MFLKFLNKLVTSAGFTDSAHFLNSAFHPEFFKSSFLLSISGATIAYYVDYLFGLNLPMGVAILILYVFEFWTGLKASKKEGVPFDSELFGKGWFKLLTYLIMLGASHIFATHHEVKEVAGLTFNIYEWLHYGFFNYIVINLFWSNLENFKRLGWHEFTPILKHLSKYIKDEKPIIKK
jgi:phage-related holin